MGYCRSTSPTRRITTASLRWKDVTFSILGLNNDISPRQQVTLRVQPADAPAFDIPVVVRIDTPIEKEYYLAGGILQYVLTQILQITIPYREIRYGIRADSPRASSRKRGLCTHAWPSCFRAGMTRQLSLSKLIPCCLQSLRPVSRTGTWNTESLWTGLLPCLRP